MSIETAMSRISSRESAKNNSDEPSTIAEATPAARPCSRRAAAYVISTPKSPKSAGIVRAAHSFSPNTAKHPATAQ